MNTVSTPAGAITNQSKLEARTSDFALILQIKFQGRRVANHGNFSSCKPGFLKKLKGLHGRQRETYYIAYAAAFRDFYGR